MNHIIAFSDFAPWRPLPASMSGDDRLAAAIRKAHDIALRDLLGPRLHYLVLENQTAEPYLSLIEGGEYTDGEGFTIMYQGLRPFLVWEAYGWLLRDTQGMATPSGARFPESGDSTAASESWYAMELQAARGQADMWARQADSYIRANAPDFHSYQPRERLGQIGATVITQPPYYPVR